MSKTAEITNLKYENSTLKLQNTELNQKVLELKAINEYYEEQFKLMQKRMYAAKSEKTDSNQLALFDNMLNEAESQSDLNALEPDAEKITYTRKKKRTNEELRGNLEIHEEIHELEDDECICEVCNSKLHVMGSTSRDEIDIIPAKAVIKRHITKKYSCRVCETNGIEVKIKKANAPKPLIKGSMATPSALTHIITQKYMNAVPLYRQEQYLNKLGVNLSRQTMSNWILNSNKYLELIYVRLKELLVASDIINADETSLQVLKEDNRKATQKSYMWLYKSNKYNKKIALYEYQESRSQKHPIKFLKGFKGFLQTDGYAAYNNIKNVTHLTCMAHIRRKFKDALDILPKDKQKDTLTYAGFNYCNQLYQVERKIQDLQPEEKHKERLQKSKPIFDDFENWIKEQSKKALKSSAYGKAVIYANNHLHKVKNYLLDGRLELDNNTAERSIKPFVIGRKNWLFSNTPKGAKASAIIYSLIETAKDNDIKVPMYLRYIYETLKEVDDIYSISNTDLDKLLPWSEEISQQFSNNINK